MITLTVRAARTAFDGPESQLETMFKALRIKDKSSYWRAKYALSKHAYVFKIQDPDQRKRKIEQITESSRWNRFYDRRSDTFHSGLLSRVTEYLDKKGIQYKVKDERKPLPDFDLKIKKFRFKDKVEVREEQLRVVIAALKNGRGILNCATNFGKTEVACAIIAEYYHQTGSVPRVAFYIHRAGLVQQTYERFKKHLPDDIDVTMVGSGEKEILGKGVLVATVQTAKNLLETYDFSDFQEACDIMFIDEFHLNKAWSVSKIAEHNYAPMRFGLSGTIDEKSKKKMMHYVGMTGPIIASVRNKELVEKGRSARPFAIFREVHSEPLSNRIRFAQAYREGVVYNKFRNKMIVKDVVRHLKKDRKVLVTVARIAHGNILKTKLENRIDLRVEFIHGGTSLDIRKKIIQKFEKGKVSVLIASPIFDVGMDVPSINGWVNAAGGKGWELVLQRLGRVLRRKQKGENKVYISDYVDKQSKFLFKHSMARIKHYLKEEVVEIEVRER